MNSSSEINNCREIIPYVTPVHLVRITAQENQRDDISEWVLIPSNVSSHPRENVLETPNESEITPHQLTGRKTRLINAELIALSTVSFVFVPLVGEANIYTIKLNKGDDSNDPFRLNRKYHDILNNWKCEKRRRPNGQCDKVYYHTKKRSICRSVRAIRRYILDGYEKVEVEVDSETNIVKEIKIGSPKRPSKKRKKEISNSLHTITKHKDNNDEPHVGSEVAPTSEKLELEETSEFMVLLKDNVQILLNNKRSDMQSSSDVFKDDVLMQSLVQEDGTESTTNLNFHEATIVLHKEGVKVKEGANKVVGRLSKTNELDSEFSQSIGKEYPGPLKFDKPSSSDVSMDVLHMMSSLFQEEKNASFANLKLQNIVPEDKLDRENDDDGVVTLAKNEELTIKFSYNEEHVEQIPMPQSLEFENSENALMEKGLPYEDNYGKKEMNVSLTNNVKLVVATDFTPNKAENDKEGLCITTNFDLAEVSPQMEIDNAKEGEKTMLEDSHEKEDHVIAHDNFFANMNDFDLFSPKEGLYDPFLLYGIETNDFADGYTTNMKDI